MDYNQQVSDNVCSKRRKINVKNQTVIEKHMEHMSTKPQFNTTIQTATIDRGSDLLA